MHFPNKRSRWTVLFFAALVISGLSCRTLNGLIPSGVPLAERDLSAVVLKSSELPAGSSFTPGDTLAGPAQFEGQIFVDYPDVHTGLVNAYYVSFHTGNWERGYVNGIMVYDSLAQAQKAYNVVLGSATGDKVDSSQIGDESIVMRNDSGLLSIMILWRYKEAVTYLTIFHIDNAPLPATNNVTALAQAIQDRLVNGK
jgi:hypothetical protein